MNTLTFRELAPESFNALCAQARAQGLDMSPIAPDAQTAAGEVTTHGCSIRYAYASQPRVLTLTVVDKPWIVPMETVMRQLRQLVLEGLTKTGAAWQE